MCKLTTSCALILLIAIAGCSDSSTAPESEIDADAFAIAAAPMLGGFTFGPGGLTSQFDCPAGGNRKMQGTTSFQPSDTEFSSTWDFTVQHNDCAVRVNEKTIVTSGTTNSTGHMRVRTPVQIGGRIEFIEFEARDHGQLTTRVGDQTRTCAFDITQRYDAARREMRITGRSCGQSISITRPLP